MFIRCTCLRVSCTNPLDLFRFPTPGLHNDKLCKYKRTEGRRWRRLQVHCRWVNSFLVWRFVGIKLFEVYQNANHRFFSATDNNYAKVQYERAIQIRGDPIVKAMPNLTIIQGETFVKHCPVAGYPVEQIDWLMGEFVNLFSMTFQRSKTVKNALATKSGHFKFEC